MSQASAPAADATDEMDPRIKRSRRLVLEAALDELAEAGYGAFTIDSVSQRCGVARSTIYRHWPDKLAVISDAFEVLNRQPGGPGDMPDASARDRVYAIVEHLAEAFQTKPFGPLLPALVAGSERNPDVAEFFHAYAARRRAGLEKAIRDCVEAGEAREEVDPGLAAFALAGAVVYCRLMTAMPLPPSRASDLVDVVLGRPGAG